MVAGKEEETGATALEEETSAVTGKEEEAGATPNLKEEEADATPDLKEEEAGAVAGKAKEAGAMPDLEEEEADAVAGKEETADATASHAYGRANASKERVKPILPSLSPPMQNSCVVLLENAEESCRESKIQHHIAFGTLRKKQADRIEVYVTVRCS